MELRDNTFEKRRDYIIMSVLKPTGYLLGEGPSEWDSIDWEELLEKLYFLNPSKIQGSFERAHALSKEYVPESTDCSGAGITKGIDMIDTLLFNLSFIDPAIKEALTGNVYNLIKEELGLSYTNAGGISTTRLTGLINFKLGHAAIYTLPDKEGEDILERKITEVITAMYTTDLPRLVSFLACAIEDRISYLYSLKALKEIVREVMLSSHSSTVTKLKLCTVLKDFSLIPEDEFGEFIEDKQSEDYKDYGVNNQGKFLSAYLIWLVSTSEELTRLSPTLERAILTKPRLNREYSNYLKLIKSE